MKSEEKGKLKENERENKKKVWNREAKEYVLDQGRLISFGLFPMFLTVWLLVAACPYLNSSIPPWINVTLAGIFLASFFILTAIKEKMDSKRAVCRNCGKEKPLALKYEHDGICQDCLEELLPLAMKGKVEKGE